MQTTTFQTPAMARLIAGLPPHGSRVIARRMTTTVTQDIHAPAATAHNGHAAPISTAPDALKNDTIGQGMTDEDRAVVAAAITPPVKRKRGRPRTRKDAPPPADQIVPAGGHGRDPIRVAETEYDSFDTLLAAAAAKASEATKAKQALQGAARIREAELIRQLAEVRAVLELNPEATPTVPAPRQRVRAPAKAQTKPRQRGKGRRLARRSAANLAAVLDTIVKLVGKTKDGMRAEHIREKLNLDRRELPRVLKLGLAEKRLKCSGQKRATVYRAGT